MATYEEIMQAARNADAAGDEGAARRLVQMAQSLQQPKEAPTTGADLPMVTEDPNGRGSLDERIAEKIGGVSDFVDNAGNAVIRGATFGLVDDEARAGLAGMLGYDYEENLARERAAEAAFAESNPIANTGLEVAGSMVAPGGAIASTRGVLAKVLAGGLTGGAAGGLYGFMEGEGGLGDRMQAGKELGVLGAALGGAVPLAGAAVSRGINRVRQNRAVRRAAESAPTPDQNRVQANALYDQLDGVEVSTQGISSLADDIATQGRNLGMDEMLTPQAVRVSQNISEAADEAGRTIPWRDLDILRRQAAIPAGDLSNRTQSNIGSMMANQIDDYVDTVAPELGEVGAEARRMWGVLRRSELLDSAFRRAELAASGFENGLQQEFRRILKSDKLSRGFSDLEKEAMRRVVNPGPLRGLLRQVGRMGYSLDGGSNAAGGALGTGLGGLLGSSGGPMGAAIGATLATALGTGARTASQALRTRDANRARAVVRMLDAPQLPALTNQKQTMLDEILLRSVRGGAIAH